MPIPVAPEGQLPECRAIDGPSLVATRKEDLGMDLLLTCTSVDDVAEWNQLIRVGGLMYDGPELESSLLALSSGAPSTDGVPGRLAFFGIGFAGVVLILLGVVLRNRAPASRYYAPVPADDGDGGESS